jgi:hypothetical protein
MQHACHKYDAKPRYRTAKNLPVKLSVRVTYSERDDLRDQAKRAGMSVSRYLARTVCDRRYPPTLKDRDALFRACFLLEKAGVNLNQIAHRLNAAALGAPVVPPSQSEIREIARTVRSISMQIKERLK